MKINVTSEDIKNGIRWSPSSCALTLAIGRARGESVSVGITCVMIGEEFFSLPQIARDFRRKFDDGKTVEPFEFELDSKI
jgi:hypothetical protein